MKMMIALLGLLGGLVMGQAHGAVQLQVENGILTGATGVNVNGVLYDVTFTDGTCIDLFDGCTTGSASPFPDLAATKTAMEVLLSTVFVDSSLGNFDTNPQLTRGCVWPTTPSGDEACNVMTPYTFTESAGLAGGLANQVGEQFDRVLCCSSVINSSDDFADVAKTFAVWSLSPTPVPAPSVLPLAVIAALSGFGAISLRKRQQVH